MRHGLLIALALLVVALGPAAGSAAAACGNPVSCENALPGSPPSSWQVSGAGDSTIVGYATQMSVNTGQTIRFKIKSTATAYHIDIYRVGYYQGNGARLQASNIRPTVTLPQSQPACLVDGSTGLVDCGNWAVSAQWTVPSTVVSGVYIARLVRDDTGGASQIPFVVRDDARASDMLIKTSDTTWQAYNLYGGNSLYKCTVSCPPGNPSAYKGAFAVSYNRPFDGTLEGDGGRSFLFYAEYQMIRFVERNGYDASYTSQADVDADAVALRNHKLIVSSGHDEYWSAGERANVEGARDAGVNLAFFSGNEVFWKTRWAASSTDGATPRRTLITYKDTHFDAPTDPLAWTGTWRDPRVARPGQGTPPENSLTGQLFIVNAGTSDITVPGAYRNLRLWRNTAVANLSPTGSLTLAPGGDTLGYEWDLDVDNGLRPAGAFRLSSTTVSGLESFYDYGSGVDRPTTQTHNLMMYRAPSGALVFGAGTVQWAWGLDTSSGWLGAAPSPSGANPDPTMQQATVNLFADMGQQPDTLMAGLTATSKSTDTVAPTATIASPAAGAAITDGARVTVSGTASDAAGTVAGVEVSTDGGTSWHPATGTTSWTYSWVAHGAPHATVMARAVDDSGNLQGTPANVTVDIGCPCTMAGNNVTPWQVDSGDGNSLEIGVRFKSDLNGTINGIRFYKAATNTGTHVGSLWKTDGTLLARANFSGESGSGWQQVTFPTPVDIAAGTTYIASYYAPAGHYSESEYYFYSPSPVGGNTLDSPPLHALVANGGAGNGVFAYASAPTFPALSGDGTNYAVDVLFTPALPPGPVSSVTATAGPGSATVSFSAPAGGGVPSRYVVTPYIGTTAQPTVTVTGSPPSTSVYVNNLDPGASYTFRVQAANTNGTSALSPPSNGITPAAPTAPGVPTGLVASQGNAKVNLRWTEPADGGRTITSYTVTPYASGIPLSPTVVSGSPAPTTAIIPGLANGTAYTFTVRATNSAGTGLESAPSNAVTPSPSPEFIQRMTVRNPSAASVQMTPAANVTQGNRIIVMAGTWSWTGGSITGVTDTAGDTYAKVTSIRASDGTELSVWTAPVTAGGGTKPAIRVTANGTADIGAAAVEYANLSTAADAVDRFVTTTGTATTTGFVSSGPTAAVTGDNSLALGFYADSGFGRSLLADPAWAERVNVSPTDDMEFVVEESLPSRGDTPNARVSTVLNTPWSMATVVFKSGAPQPPVLGVSPGSLSFSGTEGGASPAAKTLDVSNLGGGTLPWTVSDDASWLTVSPSSGTGAGTLTVTPSLSGLTAGTYTANVTVTASGVSGSPKVIPVMFTVAPPSPPSLAVSPATLVFSATTGGTAPAAKTLAIDNTGGGSMSWTASESVSWLSLAPTSGTNAGTVTVAPSITGLTAGTYTTDVTIAAPGANGTPKTVAVTLTVTDPPACPTPTGLVAAYGFDETSGTTATDASPTHDNGTINGPLRSTIGRFGGALSFDGVNDLVTVPDAAPLDLTNGMTLEAWVNPTTADSAWRSVLLKERPGNLVYALYGSSNTGRPSAHVQTPLESDTRGTAAVAANTWTHLAATYDGTTLRLYVNGTQVSSRAVTGSMAASTGVLSIGGNGVWGEWFAGLVDELRVYNRALAATEVSSDMTTPVTCAGPPALAVTPSTLSFSATQGGAQPAAKPITVSNTGGGSMSWTASEGVSWLSLAPTSGTNAGTVTVTPSITGLTAGTYTTDVTIAAPGAGGTPKTVAVTLTVDPPPPVLDVTPASLSFSGTAGAADPASKTLSIANTGGGTLSWTASDNATWLSVAPGSGTNPGTVTVTPSITGLAAGTYTANVTLSAIGATGSPKTIAVTLTLDPPATPPVLSVTPASLTFNGTQGGASPAANSLTVSNTGGGTLSWTAADDVPWLSVSPAAGTGAGSVTVTPDTSGLTAGTYNGTVTVTAAGVDGSTKAIPVTLTVDPPPPPTLAVTPGAVTFTTTQGAASPAAQTVSVTNTGSGSLEVSASSNASWLAVTPATATAPATLTLTPTTTALAAGTYTATVTVTATTAGATGSPKTVAVTLTVNPATTAGLVAAWGFDETSGTTAVDATGHGQTGTLSGPVRSTAGRFGGALSFDGVNDWVTVPDSNTLDLTTAMTIEAWVNPTAVGTAWRTVLLKEQPTSNLIYSLYAGDGGGHAATNVFTTADRGITATTAMPLSTWTHLAATYDRTTLRLYVNGMQVATRSVTGNIKVSTGVLRIGGNNIWGEWFAGLIDEVRLYSRALTATEVQTDMTTPINAP